MRLIQYNDSSFTLRFEYPAGWNAQSITGVNITITDVEGNSLLAATAATLYTATTLGAAASVGDSTITLASGASAVSPGDRLQIAASTTGPTEDITAQSYNSTTRVITLERELRYAHTSAAAVKGLWCTYALSTSTTTTWTKGLQVLIDWDPDTDDLPVRERGEVVISAYGPADFVERFRTIYPDEYDAFVDNLNNLVEEARRQLDTSLLSHGCLMDRIQDQSLLTPVLAALVRRLIAFSGGDRSEHEQDVANKEYARLFDELTRLPIWADDDQDGIRDEEEIDDYGDWQLLNSSRGF